MAIEIPPVDGVRGFHLYKRTRAAEGDGEEELTGDQTLRQRRTGPTKTWAGPPCLVDERLPIRVAPAGAESIAGKR